MRGYQSTFIGWTLDTDRDLTPTPQRDTDLLRTRRRPNAIHPTPHRFLDTPQKARGITRQVLQQRTQRAQPPQSFIH